MESAHLDRAATEQQLFMQVAQPRLERLRTGSSHATLHQRIDALCRARIGELAQPLRQALAHLARCLAREGDGENLLRLRAIEQRAQDTRHQHPRLARAGAGLDGDAAPRVAGDGVEGLARGLSTIDAIGGRIDQNTASSPSGQWSRRHRPRALQ